ncbi:MAG: hypothetical protein IKJ06_01655 [Clostridia bacterium]|nr:hypothetical protein [Clostridia bacterium]MBR4030085.1 hypothetical protein [Clostridia bacterium]
MALDKLKKGCPYGREIAKEIEAGGNEQLNARVTELEETVESLTTALAAVLAADKTTDNGKTLQIDSNGVVALVTV